VSRRAALLAWSLATLSLALHLVGTLLSRAAELGASELPSSRVGDPISLAITLAMMLIFSVVGAIVVSRHPRNTIGWLFCGTGLVASLSSFTGGYADLWLASGFDARTLAETSAWFSSWLWIPLVLVPPSLLLLLFPDGRPPSPRWRPVAWCAVLGIVGFVAGYALQPGPMEDFPEIVNPYGVDSPVLEVVGLVGVIAVGGSMVASAVSLIVRLRRAGGRER
jgi:hypothetical protein